MRFVGFRLVGSFLFIVLFSCRTTEARFTLRLLGLKFGGFWVPSYLLTFWSSFTFGFIPEAVVMPAVLATISTANPFPTLVHVVKW